MNPTIRTTEGSVNDQEALIAVMGATGVGKSSFINLASGSNDLHVGNGLKSCTSEVQLSKRFVLDGRYVTLVDTPGFDDTTKSDAEILRLIGAFLASSYEEGKKLNGIIYIHRIADPRMGGISLRNFGLFRKLCGTDCLKNVILLTNWWGDVKLEVAEQRESELINDAKFWKPVLKAGAITVRHDHRTLSNAQDILRRLIHNVPKTLLIQEQLVDKQMQIVNTDAGNSLKDALLQQAVEHNKEMRALRMEMEEAMRKKDEATRKELEDELQVVTSQVKRLQESMVTLKRELRDERRNAKDILAKRNIGLKPEVIRHPGDINQSPRYPYSPPLPVPTDEYTRAKDAGEKMFKWIPGARKLGRKLGAKIFLDAHAHDEDT